MAPPDPGNNKPSPASHSQREDVGFVRWRPDRQPGHLPGLADSFSDLRKASSMYDMQGLAQGLDSLSLGIVAAFSVACR